MNKDKIEVGDLVTSKLSGEAGIGLVIGPRRVLEHPAWKVYWLEHALVGSRYEHHLAKISPTTQEEENE